MGVIGEEGVMALSTGLAATGVGYFIQGWFKFGGVEFFKIKAAAAMGEKKAWDNRTAIYLGAAAGAEFIADIFLCPLEACRIRSVRSRLCVLVARGCGEAHQRGGCDPRLLLGLRAHPLQTGPIHDGQVRSAGARGRGHGQEHGQESIRLRCTLEHWCVSELWCRCRCCVCNHLPSCRHLAVQGEQSRSWWRWLHPLTHDEHHEGDWGSQALHTGSRGPLRDDRNLDRPPVRHLRHSDEELGCREVPLPRTRLGAGCLHEFHLVHTETEPVTETVFKPP